MKLFSRLAAIILLVPILGCKSTGYEKLSLEVSTEKDSYASGESIRATLVLRNNADEAIFVNKRMAVNFEGIIGSLGEVYYLITDPDGEVAVFAAKVNIGFPEPDDFTELALH